MIILYNILFFTGITLSLPLIIPIVSASSKRRKTVLQRLGFARIPKGIRKNRHYKPKEKPIWVHALSVGEVISAVPLVKKLKDCFENKDIVFSVSTKTGFETATKFLKESVGTIFFFPYDLPFSVKHVARRIDPALIVIVESDVWPNFMFEMKRLNVPAVLVNARLSRKSFIRHKRFSFFTKELFLPFSKICVRSIEDARCFRRLGVPPGRITVTGNVKFDQEYDPVQKGEIEGIKRSMKIEPWQKILLAGSTHKGEEAILLDAFSMMKKRIDRLLLIVAPRDPERAGSVCQIFKYGGFSAVLMKELDRREQKKGLDVIVIDVIGVLRRLYAVADVAFVGGSLVNCGGHNPLEPAAFSKPIIFGQDMSNFAEISRMLIKSAGAVQVQDAAGLYKTVTMLIEESKKAQRVGKNAFNIFHANSGAVERILKVINEQNF